MANATYQQRSMTRDRAARGGGARHGRPQLDLPVARHRRPGRGNAERAEGLGRRRPTTAPSSPPTASTVPRCSSGRRSPTRALAPALVALARDPDDPEHGVDFSGLEIGHLGHIYEGLLSLRLSVADRDFDYDRRADRYVAPTTRTRIEVAGRASSSGSPTRAGARAAASTTRAPSSSATSFASPSARPSRRTSRRVREARRDGPGRGGARSSSTSTSSTRPAAAPTSWSRSSRRSRTRSPSCSARSRCPRVRDELDALRAAAGTTFGAGSRTPRCSSAWCSSAASTASTSRRWAPRSRRSRSGSRLFVPGLSLAYLDHNVQVGNSLIGVVRPDDVAPEAEARGTAALFDDQLATAMAEAARLGRRAARPSPTAHPTRSSASDESRGGAAREGRGRAARPRPLDRRAARARGRARAASTKGPELAGGTAQPRIEESLLAERANELAAEHRALHWPIEFAEVFAPRAARLRRRRRQPAVGGGDGRGARLLRPLPARPAGARRGETQARLSRS